MQLTPELLLRAYAVGIFPMAESRNDPEIHWIDPELRGVIPLDAFHIPRKLRRKVLRGDFEVRVNTAFSKTIHACAERQNDRPETWINPTIERLYTELHSMGFAHSVECWQEDDAGDMELVGGLYGVSLGAAFFGESMFSRVTDASKVALVHLAMRLRRDGFQLLDTQFTTPHLRQFGTIDLPREAYKSKLSKALMDTATLHAKLDADDVPALLDMLQENAE